MNRKELEFILQQGEGQYIEFKESFDKSLAKEIVAFANANGGRIFLGVDDKGKLKRINITNRLKSQILDIAKNCDPSIKVVLEEFSNIIIINVYEGGDKPHKCSSGFYLRQGANSQKMTRDEILDFAVCEGKIKFDSQINNRFDFEKDFDKEKLDNYLKRAGLSNLIPVKNILKDLGVSDGNFNNAGVLFFAKKPQQFIPPSVFTCVLFRDKEGSEVIDRKEITGSLVEIVEKVMNFVEFYVKVAYKFTGKPKRENIYEYSLEAIREAVINSVMHKNYFESGHNNILKIFPDKIQMENIWIKPAHFKIKETVFRRNPIIANLFLRIHFGEKLGSGFARMEYYYKKENAPVPKIRFTNILFYVVFRQNPEYLKLKAVKVGEKLELNERQRFVFDYLKSNLSIRSMDIQKKFGVTRDTANRDLNELIKLALIKREGIGKAVRYKLK